MNKERLMQNAHLPSLSNMLVQYRSGRYPYQGVGPLYWTFSRILHLIQYLIDMFIRTCLTMFYCFRLTHPIILIKIWDLSIDIKRAIRRRSQGVQYTCPSPAYAHIFYQCVKISQKRPFVFEFTSLPCVPTLLALFLH